MLCAAILENDALDDIVLDILGVLPSSGSSDFENAIATYLEGFIRTHESNSSASCQSAQVAAVEYISSLGSMLLERMVYHVWTRESLFELDILEVILLLTYLFLQPIEQKMESVWTKRHLTTTTLHLDSFQHCNLYCVTFPPMRSS
jgi:hypothetical protein